MKRLKTSLLACAALGALGLPVVASQGYGPGLRGMFQSSGASHGTYLPAQSWQQQRLYVQTQGHPYAAARAGTYGAPQAYTPAPVRVAEAGFGLRGLSDPYAVTYSPSAARAFHRDRNVNVGGVNIRTSVQNSRDMLDWQENTTGRTLTLLANRANGVLKPNSLYLGGALQGAFMYQKTEVDGQFPLLSRFPFFSNRTDDEAGVFAINNAALTFTSTFGEWTTLFLQPEYSETEYPGEQDEFQLRKAFVVFGNLERSPFYAAFGRKTIDFGNFDSYNAFTNNEGHHYFWAVSDQPVGELGFYANGFKLTASAFSGGRQLRVALADEENNIANYAVSAEKEFLLPNRSAFTLGGGYLHDTIYRDNWTAHTFAGRSNGTPPTNFIRYRNSLVNGFAEYNSPFLDAMVEYTTTLEPWAAAIPQSIDGTPFPQFLIDPLGSTTDLSNIDFDEKLSVLIAQVRVKPIINGRRVAFAASGSWGNISDDTGNVNARGEPTSFEDNQQHAVSVEYPVNDFLDVGAEYVYNKGFIPFVAPQQVSNDQTEAHAINVGFKVRF
ncbi:MAG: hypothetical protein WBA35_14840 [Litorimonas sp.]